jgi:dipeptidyl aminopeptidase/acylaminoacyl peptidase
MRSDLREQSRARTILLRVVAAAILTLAALATVVARAAEPAPRRFAATPVVFPAYDTYKGIARYAPTPEAYAAAQHDARYLMERITYRSDDLEVFAYVYRPRETAVGQRLPVVIFNRGSYVRDDFSPEVLMLAHRLAEQGFLTVAPMYRGSGGAAGHDEMGGADLHDLWNVLPVLKQMPEADADRVFLYGESRGGIMCLLAARDQFPARAIAVYGAITDLAAFIGEGQPARAMAPVVWPGFPANEAEIVRSRSAVRWPEKIGVPILIMNGGADADVSPSHALALATALEALHKPYELKIFYGEKHTLAGGAVERDADVAHWFARFDTAANPQDR